MIWGKYWKAARSVEVTPRNVAQSDNCAACRAASGEGLVARRENVINVTSRLMRSGEYAYWYVTQALTCIVRLPMTG